MKLFIKADNYTIKFALIMTAIADIAFIVSGIKENTMKTSLAIACGLTILVALLWMVARNEGLVIEKDKLYYKSIRKKYYELNQIAGLHIVKDQIYLGNLNCILICCFCITNTVDHVGVFGNNYLTTKILSKIVIFCYMLYNDFIEDGIVDMNSNEFSICHK